MELTLIIAEVALWVRSSPLAGILQLQAVERILVILNFAKPQMGIAITDDLAQSGHVMTLPRPGNFGSEFA